MSKNISWNSEQDEILIKFVKNHEILYNVQFKDYRKTELKQNLWREIGGNLNKTDVECNKRWAYIRDYYVRRKGKPGTGTSSEAAKKRSDLLSFLDSYSSVKRSTISNIPENEESMVTEDTDSEQRVVIKKDTARDIDDFPGSQNKELTKEERKNECDCKKKRNLEDLLPSKKIKKTSPHSEERLQLLKHVAQRQSLPEEKDETDLFFSAMAKIVKKLPYYEQAQLRMQIGTLVGNAELKYWSNQREYSHSPLATTSNSSIEFLDNTLSPTTLDSESSELPTVNELG